MNSKVFTEIIQLNKDFYDSIGEDFSRTRQNSWEGWSEMLERLESRLPDIRNRRLRILDIGCGNGRFLKFLKDRNFSNFEYLGVDSNKLLLDYSTIHYDASNVQFRELDGILNLAEIAGKFDLIFAFGIVHHIPSFEFRQKWFHEVLSKLNHNGIFVFTTWNYDRDSRFGNAVKSVPNKFREVDLESGDYFVGWDKRENVYRYVHIYNDHEIKNIFEGANAIITEKFSADGKNKNLNDYYFIESGL